MEISDLSSRSKFFFNNTMLCLLKALEGRRVVIEIRNDCVVRGKLLYVDSAMGLNMDQVVMANVRGKETTLDQFYVQGRMIRYIQIPDDVDIIETMKWQLGKISVSRKAEREEKSRLFREKVKRQSLCHNNSKRKTRSHRHQHPPRVDAQPQPHQQQHRHHERPEHCHDQKHKEHRHHHQTGQHQRQSRNDDREHLYRHREREQHGEQKLK